MENAIRGAVFSKYSNTTAFAKSIGWSRNKASRILNGVQSPSADDMEQISQCIGISDAKDFISVFFPKQKDIFFPEMTTK